MIADPVAWCSLSCLAVEMVVEGKCAVMWLIGGASAATVRSSKWKFAIYIYLFIYNVRLPVNHYCACAVIL